MAVTAAVGIRSVSEEKSMHTPACPTTLLVNDGAVMNLWDAPVDHYEDIVFRIVPLPIDRITLGINTLTVRVETCPEHGTSTKPMANDVVISSVVVEVQ